LGGFEKTKIQYSRLINKYSFFRRRFSVTFRGGTS